MFFPPLVLYNVWFGYSLIKVSGKNDIEDDFNCTLTTFRFTTVARRFANLGDFPPKNANLGIFLAFGELGDF
jgi:hypothetical protein